MYIEVPSKFERLHRLFLEVVSREIENLGYRDLSAIQALLLYRIADQKLSVSDVTRSGYYLGSNVSYNLKRLIKNGYVIQERSSYDARSRYIYLSAPKGISFYKSLEKRVAEHLRMFMEYCPEENLKIIYDYLDKLEFFWKRLKPSND